MPTYQYACAACGHQLEAVQAFTDDPLTVCPECGGSLRKVFSAVGVVFKGSGFYRNDSRSDAAGNGKPANGSDAKSPDTKSSESSGSGSSGAGSSGSGSSGSGSSSGGAKSDSGSGSAKKSSEGSSSKVA